MKKLIASLVIGSLLISTPAIARDYGQKDRKEWRHHNKKQERKGGCGWLCGVIIGGVVVGALSSKDRERSPDYDRQRDYDNRYYPPNYHYDRRYCVREQITEWRYGERYVYWQTTCN